ncbi:iron-containing alcohol dehydrogenase [Carboxylicivirga sediminis]|uniref:Iron-containing alcohol dehydrogenase n=1 Tax=Carboxylicivirga sediminis TaxID=2006564 RepID=A0A941F5U6_9BACT|nr:iron-containing alcohol dehydrogenase [Carboxylicivirga sediminis]MBR8537393.1 iron-containing alcohol dehydrogenase [Carboxylicivirga sediminis]
MWTPQNLYSKFILKQPHILFGENAMGGLKTLPMSRLAVIHGTGINERHKELITKSTSAFSIKFIKKTWADEPTRKSFKENLKDLEEFQPDVILAIGGGSVLDGAKILRCLYEFPYFDIENNNFSMLEWSTKFIAIPTTIGSGSELSSAAVLINEEKATKEFVVSHSFIPEVVVFDSIFLENAPKKVLLLSCIDALAHLIEGYVSNVDNELIDVYAEKALSLIASNYKGILDSDKCKIQNLQMASYFAGMVQNHCIVGACHAIAHQLGAMNYPHALGIALVLTEVIKANAKNKEALLKYNKLAKSSGLGESYEDLIALINKVKSELSLESEISAFKDDLGKMYGNTILYENIINDKGGQGNPVVIDKAYIDAILKSLMV